MTQADYTPPRNEPQILLEGEDVLGCLAANQSGGERPASERAAIEEENRLAEEYADMEGADEDESNDDVIDNEDLEEAEDG